MFADIFNNDAFRTVSLLQAVEKVERIPNRLGSLNLFTPNPIRTEAVAIEMREGKLSIIQTSDRGAPMQQRVTEKRNIRDFRTRRIAKADRILASEIAFVREFNTEQQVMQVQTEIARRLSGPSGLVADIEATWEHMRLGAVQGVVLDADGSVIYDWNKEFGIKKNAEINFDLGNHDPAVIAAGTLRKRVQAEVVRPMRKSRKGAMYSGIRAICGSNFFDQLINHPEVRETYLNQAEASDLREGYDGKEFRFAGVTWEEYDGSDDNETIAIHPDKVKFFPEGTGNGVFEVAFAPGEQFGHIGKAGEPIYPMIVPDRDRDSFVDLEVTSYPLFICKRPEMLYSGKLG